MTTPATTHAAPLGATATPATDALPTAGDWAEVRAHEEVTRYRRSGAGPAVLLLDTREEPAALWPELLRQLSDRFRFTLPEVPRGAELTTRWLAGFLEGLGAPAVAIIAVGGCTIPAFELAMRGSEQVSRVVLVPLEPGDAEASGVMSARVPGAPVPMLVVRRPMPAPEAVPLIRGFLAEGEGAATG
jgi:hypothetical protein